LAQLVIPLKSRYRDARSFRSEVQDWSARARAVGATCATRNAGRRNAGFDPGRRSAESLSGLAPDGERAKRSEVQNDETGWTAKRGPRA